MPPTVVAAAVDPPVVTDNVTPFPISQDADETLTYKLNLLKQPGLNNDPFTIEVSYPQGWQPSELTDIHRELNALIHRSDLSEDLEFELSWQTAE